MNYDDKQPDSSSIIVTEGLVPKFTRSGARRAGDDYQDIIALNLVVQMLEHPKEFKWIKVEATEAGSLDDVFACLSNGAIVARQVKFATDPDATWSWENLLAQDSPKSLSLLQKWFMSWQRLQASRKINEASLLTNRKPGQDIQNCLKIDNRISFHKIPAKIKKEISNQLGPLKNIKLFFNEFIFNFDSPSLDTYLDAVRRRFYRIGGDELGWTSLATEMRRWVIYKNEPPPHGEIDLRVARAAANWYQLKELPQAFPIPQDYVLPSRTFHDQVVRRIKNSVNGCMVIISPPGLGKSTYLSYLLNDLRKQNIAAIRHHYFLSESDKSGNRFDHSRVMESLMSELQKRYPFSIEQNEASNPNPRPDKFNEWINNAGRYFKKSRQSLVIIIDGLDHVFREQKNDIELNKLFDNLLPAEDGVFIIVGTQPVADEQLPSRLVSIAPRDQWLELPSLNRHAVKKWVIHHLDELKIKQTKGNEYWINEATLGFYHISKGHPLVLKYSLSELVARNLRADKTTIHQLTLSNTREIEIYYKTLWRELSAASRTILCLLSACPFTWLPDGILECLSISISDRSSFIEAYGRVKHLFIQEPTGLQAFHQSLRIFVTSTDEYHLQHKKLKQQALTWLEKSASIYLRWSYEWKLNADLGNRAALINGPTRQWAVESINKRYPETGALTILFEAGKLALEERNLSKFIEHGLLSDYVSVAWNDYQGNAIHKMLEAQLYLREDPMLTLRLSAELDTLDDNELLILARFAFNEGNFSLLSRIFACINSLDRTTDGPKVTHEGGTILSQIASLTNEIGTERINKYIIHQRRYKKNIVEFTTYCRECLRSNNVSKLRELYKMQKKFNVNENSIVIHYIVLHAIENNVDIKGYVKELEINDPVVALFCIINSYKVSKLSLQFPETRPLDLKEYETNRSSDSLDSFISRCYFIFVVNHYLGESRKNEAWLEEIGEFNWPRKLLVELNGVAKKWSDALHDRKPVPYSWLFSAIEHFTKSDLRPDDNVRYGFAADEFMVHASFLMLRFNSMLGQRPHISKADVEIVFQSDYASGRRWINYYLQMNRNWLSIDACNWIVVTGIEEIKNVIEQFSERASSLTDLAILAARYDLEDECRHLVACISENLLAYGGHKDMLLHSVLDSILVCYRSGVKKASRWLLDLAPAVSEIENYTDSDETDYVPRALSKILLEINEEWFATYQAWLLRREDYYNALNGFHSYLENVDLSSELSCRLATTAIDEESLGIIKRRAELGDAGAKNVLNDIESLFGLVRIDKDENLHNVTSEYHPPMRVGFPDPSLYAPNQLDKYINDIKSDRPYEIEEPLMKWLLYWAKDTEADICLDLVEEKIQNATYHDLTDLILNLSVRYSLIDKIYPRLVKAAIRNSCWSRYFSADDKIKKYWEILKNYYPIKWYEFIKDTMYNPYEHSLMVTGSHILYRLVEYLLFFGQQELAASITEQSVKFSIQLVSPLSLKPVTWTKPYEKS